MTAVVDEYGNAASAAACDLYDETMLAEGLSLPAAEPIGETARADVEKVVRYQLRKWLDGDVSGFLEAMGGAAQYHVRRQANRTVIHNAERDDRSVTSTARDPRLGTYLPTASTGFGRSAGHVSRLRRLMPGDIAYARVPTGAETCTYCMMLASRGFAYHTEESAGHADHRGCNCLIVAGLHGSTTVEGVDVREQYRTWRAMATADAKHDAGELSDEEWQARKRAIVDAHPRATAGIPAAPSKAGGNTGERVDWYVPIDYDKIAELRAARQTPVLNSKGDPAKEYYGPIADDERAAFEKRARELGVEVRESSSEDNIFFGPKIGGNPPMIRIPRDASVLAHEHELDHAEYDAELGGLDLTDYLADPQLRKDMETRAYDREIKRASQDGYTELVDALRNNKREELEKIDGGG